MNVDVTSVVPGSLVTWGTRSPQPLIVVATEPVHDFTGSCRWTLVRRTVVSVGRTFTTVVNPRNSFTLVWSAGCKDVCCGGGDCETKAQ